MKVDPKYFHSACASDGHQMERVRCQNALSGFFEFIVELFCSLIRTELPKQTTWKGMCIWASLQCANTIINLNCFENSLAGLLVSIKKYKILKWIFNFVLLTWTNHHA